MTNIKNIVFDIGNVILHFDLDEVLPHFTSNDEEQNFLLQEVIHSPEWLSYALIDTGFLSRKHAISIVEDRTNHKNDSLIEDFWYHYNEYSFIDDNKKNVETARDLGMIGEVVTPDSYSSVYDVLEKNKINV